MVQVPSSILYVFISKLCLNFAHMFKCLHSPYTEINCHPSCHYLMPHLLKSPILWPWQKQFHHLVSIQKPTARIIFLLCFFVESPSLSIYTSGQHQTYWALTLILSSLGSLLVLQTFGNIVSYNISKPFAMALTQTLTMSVLRHAETQHMILMTLVSLFSWTLIPVCILLLHPVLNWKLPGAELPSLFFHVPTVPDTWSITMEINILQSLLLILQKSFFNNILGGNGVNNFT